MAVLSIATDMAMGQPIEFAMRSCILAVRLGEALGWDDSLLRQTYYQALLRYIGCNAETQLLATLYGDEISLRTEFATIDPGSQMQTLALLTRFIRSAHRGESPLALLRAMVGGVLSLPELIQQGFGGHCEVAQRLAARLGFEPAVIAALGQLYERWDGKGLPNGIKGDAVARSVMIVTLAQDAVTFAMLDGLDAAIRVVRERAGHAYEPRLAECFCEHAARLMAGLEDEPTWERVLSMEPGTPTILSMSQLGDACEAIADFADIKSPHTIGHSRAVAALAQAAAQRTSLPQTDVHAVYLAGFLHDIGKVAISAAIWMKPASLSEREWEQVRLHPYYSARVLARPERLIPVGTLAALHHERLNGSGYHRGLSASSLSPAARILAAANQFQGLTESRPYRGAFTPEAAADKLRASVRAGWFDSDAVDAVLAVADQSSRRPRREHLAGLSEREIEVLRLIARGHTTRQIADQLTVALKTVDNHIQHIYTKIGVTTRAGAAIFAVENNLL